MFCFAKRWGKEKVSLSNLCYILWLVKTQVYANRDLLRSGYFTCEGTSFQLGSIGQRRREKDQPAHPLQSSSWSSWALWAGLGAECVPPVAAGASLGSRQLWVVGRVFIAACLEIWLWDEALFQPQWFPAGSTVFWEPWAAGRCCSWQMRGLWPTLGCVECFLLEKSHPKMFLKHCANWNKMKCFQFNPWVWAFPWACG